MPGAGRLRDVSKCNPHGAVGPAVTRSDDVIVNDRGVLRVGDTGVYPCPCKGWRAVEGAPGVYVNKRRLHRLGDADDNGTLASASDDVTVGDHSRQDGERKAVTWVGFSVVSTGLRFPRPFVRVKVTHAGKEHVGVTDELGQFIVDGLPLEPKECDFEVLDDVPAEKLEEADAAAGDTEEFFEDYTVLLTYGGEEPRAGADAEGQDVEADIQVARAQAFLERGEREGAEASLRAALARHQTSGDRARFLEVQKMLATMREPHQAGRS